jgi:hyperosmotically inducible periplasmic protein
MKHTALATALSGLLVLSTVGCAVSREQSTVGEYVDDAAVTARVKAKFADDRAVSALSIRVETLRGAVQLSGFAKSAAEKSRAESIARTTPGVSSVINNIVVRP